MLISSAAERSSICCFIVSADPHQRAPVECLKHGRRSIAQLPNTQTCLKSAASEQVAAVLALSDLRTASGWKASGCRANNCYLQIIRHHWKPVFLPLPPPSPLLRPTTCLSCVEDGFSLREQKLSVMRNKKKAKKRSSGMFFSAGGNSETATCARHPPTLSTGVGFM